jgi:putative transposase
VDRAAFSRSSPTGRKKFATGQHWLWRAVDQDGFVLDVLVQKRRDKRAAKRLLWKLLKR